MRIDNMDLKKSIPNKELKNKLLEFGKAWKELSIAWSNSTGEQDFILQNNYPFEKCFDTLGTEVINWINTVKEEL